MTRLNRRPRSRCARRAVTLVEVLVVMALIVVAIAYFIPWQTRSTGCSNRVKCASNLRQIGQALLLYANDHKGAYPRMKVSAGPDRIPTWGTGVNSADEQAENDVTGAMFLLLRTQDITSEVFTCPSSTAEKDAYGGGTNAPINRWNFTDVKKNLSYALQNPYASDSAIKAGWKWDNTLGAEYAVAADLGPGVKGDNDNVFQPTSTSSAKDIRQANTHNHDQDGQNILYGDGHVAWESNPFVGVNRDNIYTTADSKMAASPVDANDSVLLPSDD